MIALVLVSIGCQSIYHRTHALLPPDPGEQLALRVEAARQAEKSADIANGKLDARLAQGLSREVIAPDVDRLEAAAHELERRVAAARDAAARCRPNPQLTAEIKRLDQRARGLLQRAKSVRRTGG